MITKITAENSGLYYAPAFELINQALEAAGDSLRINSLTEYYNNLTRIAELVVNKGRGNEIPGGYLLLMPADEEIFEINANTRAISVPSDVKRYGVGVYGDHRAEMLILSIDRFFDNQDLLDTEIAINWNFAKNGDKKIYSGATKAFAPNADINPDKVTFGFIIDKNMTSGRGVLTFSVTFYTQKAGDIDYSLNTLTASVVINDTLPLVDPEEVVDDTANYINRFSNSVFPNTTISNIEKPVWKSGTRVGNTFSGLPATAYFSTQQDLNNDYSNGLDLSAYAVVVPDVANVNYSWSVEPLEAAEESGRIDMGRTPISQSYRKDYIAVDLPGEDDGNLYYIDSKEVVGKIDTANPLSWTQANALKEQADDSETVPYLKLFVKKVTADKFEDEDIINNQNNIQVSVLPKSNMIYLTSLDELNDCDVDGEIEKWICLDIDTGLESIVGVKLGEIALTMDDVDKAAELGLGAGHIALWVKATDNSQNFYLQFEPYNRKTPFSVNYKGVYPSIEKENNSQEIINKTSIPTFYVKGSTFKAMYAGNYQVHAQATLNGGDYYEKVLENAPLIVGENYFIKKNGDVDKEHPIQGEEAEMTRQLGIDLYAKANATRNSEIAESSVLTIPAALQPQVNITIDSTYEFDEFSDDINWEGVVEDVESKDYKRYTYIDTETLPVVNATITLNSNNAEDYAGAFAAELIEKDSPKLTKNAIENANPPYDFRRLPTNRIFQFSPQQIKEGEYLVRAINRRNGTYSVSDPENTTLLETAFVAPETKKITVKGAPWAEGEERPTNPDKYTLFLDDGEWPEGNQVVMNYYSKINPRWTFTIENNSEVDTNKYDVSELTVRYIVQEVDEDENHNLIYHDLAGDREDESDIIEPEVITDANGNTYTTFTINNDLGLYRIKIMTYYKGTVRTNYTNTFVMSRRS